MARQLSPRVLSPRIGRRRVSHQRGLPCEDGPLGWGDLRRLRLGNRLKRCWLARALRKSHGRIAVSVFVVIVARLLSRLFNEHSTISDLLSKFDIEDKGNRRLSDFELQRLLKSFGLDMSENQVRAFFGSVDAKDDGFDAKELMKVVSIVSDLPAVHPALRSLGSAHTTLYLDMFLALVAGIGVYLLLNKLEISDGKLAANKFISAVQKRKLLANVESLENTVQCLIGEKAQLQKQIVDVHPELLVGCDATVESLKAKLADVQEREAKLLTSLEAEVAAWRARAERNMAEADRSFKKMERVLVCTKGLSAFDGASSASTHLQREGAQQGFAKRCGFAMDTITFGTIESGKLKMYETSESRKLGQGRDCAYVCTDLSTGQEFALKKYKIDDPRNREVALKEIFALRSGVGKHPNILEYHRIVESSEHLFVVMELITGKDLFDVIIETENGLNECPARTLFRDLALAVNHLHRHHVIHCDIKPENAMVDGCIESGTAHLKLIDFGCSCFLQFESKDNMKVPVDCYTPPEHLGGRGPTPSVASDMWRMGCTLYMMLTRHAPFHCIGGKTSGRLPGLSNDNFYKEGSFLTLTENAQNLICDLIVGEPSKRSTTQIVLMHPWLHEVSCREDFT